jgi:hypothetical protein
MAQLSERYVGKVLDVLEEVFNTGVATARVNVVLYWYGQDRLTKGIYRDIQQRWDELTADYDFDPAPELLVGREGGVLCFAYGREWDEQKKDWGEPFLKPIEARIASKSDGEEREE